MGGRFRERFQQFMIGRYGPDDFSRFLNITTIALLVLGIVFGSVFSTLGIASALYVYFRIFSRNTAARVAENRIYLQKSGQIKRWVGTRKERFAQRGTYRYFACPSCKQDLRVPKGKGSITITCPKCQTRFEKKS